MLAVIIPTYDNLKMLKRLVKQLNKRTHDAFNLYIIEDGQKPKTIKWLQKQSCNVIYHPENKGVAASWNDGLRAAIADGCDVFAIMNDDIEVPDNWWIPCKQAVDQNMHLISLTNRTKDWLFSGWFFVITKFTVDTVGFFDEQFGQFYNEDVDYAVRFWDSGLKATQLDIPVVHHESTTIEKNIKQNDPERYARVTQRGKELVLAKHKGLLVEQKN